MRRRWPRTRRTRQTRRWEAGRRCWSPQSAPPAASGTRARPRRRRPRRSGGPRGRTDRVVGRPSRPPWRRASSRGSAGCPSRCGSSVAFPAGRSSCGTGSHRTTVSAPRRRSPAGRLVHAARPPAAERGRKPSGPGSGTGRPREREHPGPWSGGTTAPGCPCASACHRRRVHLRPPSRPGGCAVAWSPRCALKA